MRKIHWVTLLTVTATCFYLGWVYYSRWRDNREFIRRLAEPKEALDRAIVEAHGRDQLTILAFYAVPATVGRGGKTQLCYGVSNSRSVRIEPPVNDVWPSFSRCVEVRPEKETTYTLVVEDAKGNKKTAGVTVKVH